MNEKQILGRVQRTLVLASGDLAERCGTLFEEKLAQRNGPTAATAVVSLNGVADTLETAVAAAEQGMKNTIPLQARKGRASYLGERSIGHQDPGATSSYLMLNALLETVKE